MFSLGSFLLTVGYALVYAGIANLRNGGQGPTIAEALGFTTTLAPPGADLPKRGVVGTKVGQAPQPTPQAPGQDFRTGGGTF